MPKIVSSEKKNIVFRPRTVKGAEVFLAQSALESMIDHADEGYLDDVEIMGLMMGTEYRDDLGTYVVISDRVTGKLVSEHDHVEFDTDMEELFTNIDACGLDIMGWYHSHPGFGCYLSDTDISTHKGLFGDADRYAMVLDPSSGELAMFKLKDGECITAAMVIMESE